MTVTVVTIDALIEKVMGLNEPSAEVGRPDDLHTVTHMCVQASGVALRANANEGTVLDTGFELGEVVQAFKEIAMHKSTGRHHLHLVDPQGYVPRLNDQGSLRFEPSTARAAFKTAADVQARIQAYDHGRDTRRRFGTIVVDEGHLVFSHQPRDHLDGQHLLACHGGPAAVVEAVVCSEGQGPVVVFHDDSYQCAVSITPKCPEGCEDYTPRSRWPKIQAQSETRRCHSARSLRRCESSKATAGSRFFSQSSAKVTATTGPSPGRPKSGSLLRLSMWQSRQTTAKARFR